MEASEQQHTETRPLAGGPLLAEITSRIVAMIREHYGRGPLKAKSYLCDDLIVCVMSDGFTAAEKTSIDAGHPDKVLEMRRDFQTHMEGRYTKMIEEITGRKVEAFVSGVHLDPDRTVELFFLHPPLQGFGALELIDAPPGPQSE